MKTHSWFPIEIVLCYRKGTMYSWLLSIVGKHRSCYLEASVAKLLDSPDEHCLHCGNFHGNVEILHFLICNSFHELTILYTLMYSLVKRNWNACSLLLFSFGLKIWLPSYYFLTYIPDKRKKCIIWNQVDHIQIPPIFPHFLKIFSMIYWGTSL